MPPRKRRIDEITSLAEPHLTPEQQRHLDRGFELFDAGKYWHAHEEWEHLWLAMPDDASGDAEIVVRGMIQLAAALHLRSIGRLDGAASNFRKASEKLALAPPVFMGRDMEGLRRRMRDER